MFFHFRPPEYEANDFEKPIYRNKHGEEGSNEYHIYVNKATAAIKAQLDVRLITFVLLVFLYYRFKARLSFSHVIV